MAKLPTCPICDKAINKAEEDHHIHSKKTYHINCFAKFELRKQHRLELLEYICDLYKIPVANGFILKQIKEYETQYNYTLKGIQMTLQFFHEISGNPIGTTSAKYKNAKGIGIVPHVYDEAKDYFIRMQQIGKAAQVEINNTTEVVYTKPPKQREKRKLIDIEGL